MKCYTHNMFAETTCSWCTAPICRECIAAAAGKKYCQKCAAKLNLRVLATRRDMQRPETPIAKTKILNIDTSLDQEKLQSSREMIIKRTEKEKKGRVFEEDFR